jgi:5-methylcytosine-specific restriction endonuclease McrA
MSINYQDETVFRFPKGASRYESKKARKTAEEAERRRVYRAVTARDGGCCRLCKRRTDPNATSLLAKGHHHHVQYRSKGGQDTTDNLLLLCAACHDGVHRGRIRLSGDADAARGIFLEVATDAGFMPERWI